MTLLSFSFLLFFFVFIIIFYCCSNKSQIQILALASILFYGAINYKACCFLLCVIIVTFLSGKIIWKNDSRFRKTILIFTIIICLSILGVNRIIPLLSLDEMIILPVGASFLTLQIISFQIDVYQGKIKEPVSFLDYLVYILFFPKVISGPLLKADFFEQLHKKRAFDSLKTEKGLIMMLFGYVQKIIMADCIVRFVDPIFTYYQVLNPLLLIAGAVAYAFYIYFDFAGYSNIAIGVAMVMGFDIPKNFSTPYFSGSVKEFWSRWHISLSTWLKEYVYIPLGGNRCGRIKKYSNYLITFVISGLWHGFGLQYIAWGMLHGLYQIAEDMFPVLKKKDSLMLHVFNTVRTFIFVDLAWVFFRSATLTEGLLFIKSIFTHWDISLKGFGIGFFGFDTVQLVLCIILGIGFFIIDYCEHKEIDVISKIIFWPKKIVWGMSLLLILLIFLVMFRTMGLSASSFIYSQF